MFMVLHYIKSFYNSNVLLSWLPDVLEGQIFLQNLPSIVAARALGNYYSVMVN